MSSLVTLDQFKGEVKQRGITHEDDVLSRKLDEAEAMCLDYVNQRLGGTASEWDETVEGWTSETVPLQVKAAILELAVILNRFRGDDDSLPAWYIEGRMPPGVRMKLDRFRDPTFA